ncbi:TPA: hypothetical protein ACH3X1_001336 [Trebouxia sp. C0004]
MDSSRVLAVQARLDAARDKLLAELDKGAAQDKSLVTSYEKSIEELKDELKMHTSTVEHEDVGVIEDVEYTWAENKYEPQQQEKYLQALKNEFLAAAMSSIPPDVLRADTWGNFNLPSVLLEPIRRRLPTPSLSQTTTLQRMNLLQQIIDGKADVADLSDLE